MALAVVNYPTISAGDFSWIQSIRKQHDRLYFHVVDPHFTIVFPTENVGQNTLVEHVRKQAGAVLPFEFAIRCAVLGDPDFEGHAHAFLIPDEGFSQIVRLHDRLYTGPLYSELRLDLPFIPHIAVANARKQEACKAIVDALNEREFEIRGRVEVLDVIGFDGSRTWTLERIPLGTVSEQKEK